MKLTVKQIILAAAFVCASTLVSLVLVGWIDGAVYERSCDQWVREGLLQQPHTPDEPIGMVVCREQRAQASN